MSDNVPDPNAGETVHVTIQISRESLCSLPIRMYWFPDGANMAGLEGLPTGRPLGDGTAFLYRYDGKVYLVTAGP